MCDTEERIARPRNDKERARTLERPIERIANQWKTYVDISLLVVTPSPYVFFSQRRTNTRLPLAFFFFLSLSFSFSFLSRVSLFHPPTALDPLERPLLYSRHISLKGSGERPLPPPKIDAFHEITRAATDTRSRARIPM